MDLHPTPDQSSLVDAVADHLRLEMPASRLSRPTNAGVEVAGLAARGWVLASVPVSAGGQGLTLVEDTLILRELGRQLAPPSALATVLAASVLYQRGKSEVLRGIRAGKIRAGFVLQSRHRADGEEVLILDGDDAPLFVSWTEAGVAVYERSELGALRRVDSFDSSVDVSLAPHPSAACALASLSGELIDARARLLTSAMLVGTAEGALDLAAQYAARRRQFGRAIGGFQAVSHRLAASAVACHSALALLFSAAVRVAMGRSQIGSYSASALMLTAEAALQASADAMQVLGARGQTYEELAHFFVKRATLLCQLAGAAESCRTLILSAEATHPDLQQNR